MPRPLRMRPRGLRLTLRALWWRRGSSLTLLAVGTVTCAAAALGPMYAAAASESTLQDRLTTSPPGATVLSFTQTADVSEPKAPDDAAKVAPQPGSIVGYPTSTTAIHAKTSLTVDGTPGRLGTQAVWRDNACAHVVLIGGRCPASPAEVMVSDRSQQNGTGIKLGSTLRFGDITTDQLDETGQTIGIPVKVEVVGLYRPLSLQDPFWAGRAYFNAHLYSGAGDSGADVIDTVFLARSFWPTTSRPSLFEVDIDYRFDPAQVRTSDEDALRRGVHEAQVKYSSSDTIRLTTGITQVLDAADHERSLLRTSTLLVTLQLALLAWLVLFQVMGDSAEARGNEIALAKLRGLRPRATVAFGLGEPLAVLTLAVPFGIGLAWLLVVLIAKAVLVPGVPLTITLTSILGALVGFAGGAVAAALAARRVLTRPVLEQWRRVPEQHQHGAASLALDAALVVAAIVGLVALRHGQAEGTPRPVALLAPGLLILTVALVGVRLLPVFAPAALAPTRASARVGAFLAVRQVLRRPAGLRLAALLAVAIGLATFAVDGEAVAQANRETRAAVEVGANQVVATQYSVADDPVAVTRKVDPDGSWAMAAASWSSNGGPLTGNLVAVDSSRLVAVANWPVASGSADDVAVQLRPPAAKPLVVTGTSIRVSVDGLAGTSGPWPNLVVRVHPAGGRVTDLRIGVLSPGLHTYAGDVPCAGGCTLRAIVIDRPIDHFETMSGSLVFTKIEVPNGGAWTALDAGLSTPGNWRPAGSIGASTDKLTPGPDGLRDEYSSTGGGSPAIGRADFPTPLPVVGTPNGLNRGPAAGPEVFIDNTLTSVAYTEVATLPVIPVGLDTGVLVDVSYARTQLPGFDNEALWSVWLSPRAPADALARLRAAGMVIDAPTSQAQRVQALGRQGPALALLLLVACAVAGALLAAGATALAVAVTGSRRSFELAALRAAGVNRRALLRSCVGEQLILLGTGLLLGVPAGLVAARLALPVIPEFSDITSVPLEYSPDVLVVGGFVVVVTALLVTTAVLSGRMLMRSAVPDKLREAAQ